MTIVEFFDGVSICNMVSCLAMKPDKIIFIGEEKPIERQKKVYTRFINSYGMQVELTHTPINRNSVEQIVSVLTDIVESEESCVFDLTGGEDLVLVAMGIVFERYRNTGKVQIHRFNIGSGRVVDCDKDGVLPDTEQPKLSVEGNIMLYGGCVVPYNGKKGTYNWDFNDDFESDLKVMWEICKTDPGLWNSLIGTLSYMAGDDSAELTVSASKTHTKELMKKQKIAWIPGLMKSFNRCGLITNLVDEDDFVSFTFKNEQVKRCLTKEGTVLELEVMLLAKKLKRKDGSFLFDDAVNGVYIDWDSELHEPSDNDKDTENEIDVVLMQGLVPVFISCKNGSVDDTELYKLNTVADRFGGPYVKKVLVSSYFGKNNEDAHTHFVQRAKDMDIELIENVHTLSDEAFAKEMKKKLC